MSTGTLEAAASAPTLRQQAQTYWRSRAPRERVALGVGVAMVLVALVWLVLVQPAWHTVSAAPAQLDLAERQLQLIQATAAEVKGLRAISPVSSTQAAAAIKAATDRLGDHGRLSMQGDRATLTLTGVTSDALLSWLNEVRSGARARPIEASLARAQQGYNGTVLVTLGGVQ